MCATVYGWRHLVKAAEVTAGLAESNGSLPLGGWLQVTCRLTAWGSALGPTLDNEYGRTLPLLYVMMWMHIKICILMLMISLHSCVCVCVVYSVISSCIKLIACS